ncbi:MAG: FAD-dependent oxidoreductase, partial [Pyrinomonadaceae bacterium]|nr:FAD-dependent oxidoreductase [Pyrinomonadaceae bacterium]
MTITGLGAEGQPVARGNEVNGLRIIYTDVCIYGGTSGGVVAAVQTARLGKSAVIVESGRHLGGMTASGLSWTDVGSSERVWIIGGLTKEFYARVGRHYGQNPESVFESQTSNDSTRRGYDFAKPPSLSFEPKVAESVFSQWVSEANVPVHFNGRLKSVRKDKGRIREIVTERGLRVRAKVFIDATYEGDL